MKIVIEKLPKNIKKTIMFRGRRYNLDQIYWDKQRAYDEAAESREHGYYSTVVPALYNGELKYVRYTANKR